MVAVLLPIADGVKVKLTVQDALGAIVPELTQVPVPALAKLVEFVPVIVKNGVAKTSEPVPMLVTVMVSGPLVVPCN